MKKNQLPRVVVLAIFALITAIVWAFFDITRTFFKKPDIKVEESTLAPIDPTLDTETLSQIQNATFFEEGQVTENIIPQASATPAPTPISEEETLSPTPTSTPLASPEPSSDTQSQGENLP